MFVLLVTILLGTSLGLDINIGILLPHKAPDPLQEPCFSVDGLHAMMDLTRRKLKTRFSHPVAGSQLKFSFLLEDSQCSDIYGPLKSMSLHYEHPIHIFYGPCCKYALAPVARFCSHVWNVPIISPGGLTPAFASKTSDFLLLTRIMPAYHKLSRALLTILASHGFRHFTVLFHENLYHRMLGRSECYYIADALMIHIEQSLRITAAQEVNASDFIMYTQRFDCSRMDQVDLRLELEQTRNQSRGRALPSMMKRKGSLIARFKGPTWGPSGADRTQVGPMLTPWTLPSGVISLA